jgi:hypothetical protein
VLALQLEVQTAAGLKDVTRVARQGTDEAEAIRPGPGRGADWPAQDAAELDAHRWERQGEVRRDRRHSAPP